MPMKQLIIRMPPEMIAEAKRLQKELHVAKGIFLTTSDVFRMAIAEGFFVLKPRAGTMPQESQKLSKPRK